MCVFVFFYLYSIRLILFVIDVPRPLRNEILDHSISKGCCVTRKSEPVCPKHLQRLLKNIVQYYSQNIWLKCINYTSCLNLSSVGKRLEKVCSKSWHQGKTDVVFLHQGKTDVFFLKYLRLL